MLANINELEDLYTIKRPNRNRYTVDNNSRRITDYKQGREAGLTREEVAKNRKLQRDAERARKQREQNQAQGWVNVSSLQYHRLKERNGYTPTEARHILSDASNDYVNPTAITPEQARAWLNNK